MMSQTLYLQPIEEFWLAGAWVRCLPLTLVFWAHTGFMVVTQRFPQRAMLKGAHRWHRAPQSCRGGERSLP